MGGGAGGCCSREAPLSRVCQQVAAEYRLVHQTMVQPPVRDYVPFSWTTLVLVKAEYFRALAHYQAALALCDGPRECPAPRAQCPQALGTRGSPPSLTPSGGRGGAPSPGAGLPRAPSPV